MDSHIHFIAIGGSVMHNLAITLAGKGFRVTGSDDQIFEPSRSRLNKHNLLPEKEGWHPERVTPQTEAVILGMHAKTDNPELEKARELHVPVYSFPEYIHLMSRDKQRIVIGGSHGKTTITAMIIHVLNKLGHDIDFLVGAELPGYTSMVRLSDAPVIIIEGDEYLSSPLDSTPKFLHYHHHIGVITGIAWDHCNVFPSFESYREAFQKFADQTPKAGTLIYNNEDKEASKTGKQGRKNINEIPYATHKHYVKNHQAYLKIKGQQDVPVAFFGSHNMQNVSAALKVCQQLSVPEKDFYEAISDFQGAARRMELIYNNDSLKVYRDFAHAPSKVKASLKAAREVYPKETIIGCLELHTFSSLNKSFIQEYANTMDTADYPLVYFDPDTAAKKSQEPLQASEIQEAFSNKNVNVFTEKETLKNYLLSFRTKDKTKVFLMMSSGNFDGLDLQDLFEEVQQN